jgi:hypothetical protein
MARAAIEMVTLDRRLEEELAKHASLKDFKVVLWRQEPDADVAPGAILVVRRRV